MKIILTIIFIVGSMTAYAQADVFIDRYDTGKYLISIIGRDTIFTAKPPGYNKYNQVKTTEPHFRQEYKSMLQQKVRELVKDTAIQGIIKLYCEINIDGAATNCVMVDAPNPLYQYDNLIKAEILKLIYDMPYWIQGTMDGKPAKMNGTLNISL